METSIFLAKLLGPFLLVVGAGIVVNAKGYQAMAEDFLASPAMIYLAGALALVGGLAIVIVHNRWALEWPLLITVFGWASIVGGIFRMTFPELVTRIGTAFMKRQALMIGAALVIILGGAYLSYHGYFA
jgi:cytochrome bd-type quinol oxidase subunit 2